MLQMFYSYLEIKLILVNGKNLQFIVWFFYPEILQ